jgi:hypothetical protein
MLHYQKRSPTPQESECNPSLCTSPRSTIGFTRNLIFHRKLVAEAVKLKEMSARSTFTRMLESEEDKKTIRESFQRIDEFTKDFHVRELLVY